jgi:hypothetical protein
MRRQAILAVAALVFASAGCFQSHRKLVLPPPAPVVEKPVPKPQIEEPPRMEAQIPPIDVERASLPQIKPPVPKPAPPKRPPATAGASSPTGPATTSNPEGEAPSSPPVVAPATPQLSEILTEDRRRQYETEFAGYVSRAREILSQASHRRANNQQQQTILRIRTFLQQAEESKVKDIVTALQLARRADLLAQDLLKSLR